MMTLMTPSYTYVYDFDDVIIYIYDDVDDVSFVSVRVKLMMTLMTSALLSRQDVAHQVSFRALTFSTFCTGNTCLS